jgi:non-heme chloroperoxidase
LAGRPSAIEIVRTFGATCWALSAVVAFAAEAAAQADTSRHKVRFVAVDTAVRLEVLDWGGPGRPVILLAGGARTAHDYDQFAPILARTYRVYGITRRGLGASSRPERGFESDRLAEDVLSVIDSLHLDRPVVVGHSRAGAELSSLGSRHPDKVSGLIYLDAGYYYAYYDPARGNLGLDMPEIRRKLERLQFGPSMTRHQADSIIKELVEFDFPMVAKQLVESQRGWAGLPDTALLPQRTPELGSVLQKMWAGSQRYSSIRAPMLALYAEIACQGDPADPAPAEDFRRLFPSARVVCLPRSEHYLWHTNEAEVLREMRAFVDKLPTGVKGPTGR